MLLSVVPNIGGSSLFSVTNRPASSIDGSGCAASDGTHRVRTLEVGDTSTGSCRSAKVPASRRIHRPDPVPDLLPRAGESIASRNAAAVSPA